MPDKVSIIIPTWNRASKITRSIQSCSSQTHKNIEIIVIDDGSTDNTEKIIKKLRNKDSRIIYIKNRHTGHPSIVRNLGIKNSTGEWLAFLDSDDFWRKNKLEKQIKIAKEKKVGLVCTNALLVSNKKKTKYFSINSQLIKKNDLIKQNRIITSSVLTKKKILLKTGLFSESPKLINSQDYELWLRIISLERCFFIEEPLVFYENNSTDSHSLKNKRPDKNIKNIFLFHFIWLIKNKKFDFYLFKYIINRFYLKELTFN